MIEKIAKQLSLWGSKRQRGVKAPPPTEFLVHVSIADSLRVSINPGWVWWHTPSGGERPKRVDPKTGQQYSPEGSRLQRMGLMSGISDFILIGPPHATVFALELKRQGKRPTEEQLAFGAKIIAAGGYWDWTDNYHDAIRIFKDWGAVPSGFKPQ